MVLLLKIIPTGLLATANRYFPYYRYICILLMAYTGFSSIAIFADFFKKEIWSSLQILSLICAILITGIPLTGTSILDYSVHFLLLVLITIMVIAKPDKTDMFIDTIYSFNPPPKKKILIDLYMLYVNMNSNKYLDCCPTWRLNK